MKIPGVAFSTAEKLFDEILHFAGCDLDFHELMVPLYVVAADKASQKSVILRHGRVFDAVRASMAIPIMLKKHKIANMKLSDGAILKPLNTRVLY